MGRLAWHVEAIDDLDAICRFIARHSGVSAQQFASRVISLTEHLEQHPLLRRVVPEVGDPSYREVLFQNYRLVYPVTGDDVEVMRVIHAAMDMEHRRDERSWDLT